MTDYKSLNTIAYEYLRNMIYSCELEFQTIYSETKLAAQISVSRTPMRDALNRLAQERYIDILPNRGFMLHTPTPEDISEAYHIRMMTESYCAIVVAGEYPDGAARATVERMEDALQQQRRLLENDGEYSLTQFWLDDLRFHKALLEHLNISSLIQQYESVMYIFMPHHLIRQPFAHEKDAQVLNRHRSTLTEHAAILSALTAKDKAQLAAAIYRHIDSSMNALKEKLAVEQKQTA